MEKIHFEILINAPREKVWNTMLGEDTYKVWTVPFNPPSASGKTGESYVKGDWSEGSKIIFVGVDPDTGEEGGMVSRIKENRPNEFMSIEHYGIYKNGVEDTESEEAKVWSPAYENYTLNDKDGGTQLLIDLDIDSTYKEMFEGMWPKALEILKRISEE